MSGEITRAVPHLTTALRGPLEPLEARLLDQQSTIEPWFRDQWQRTPPPFYASVDLRNAGFKIAPVDTNLFPAGFNNLNPDFMPLCIQAMQTAIERFCPTGRRVMIVPESHTRNTFYLENLATLADIVRQAGFEVRIGSLLPAAELPMTVDLPSGRALQLEPIKRTGNEVHIGDFRPCLVLLNNDLADGCPEVLQGLSQAVAPPPHMGWINRLKSAHFTRYQQVAREFADLLNMDPWLVEPLFRNCGRINFMKREGEECLIRNTNALLTAIRMKYQEYGIDREPFVIAKADAGTYGMGIMTVHSADELRQLNRKQRTRMSAVKGGREVRQVILQEGVYTSETWEEPDAVAEPVVYMTDRFVVGGFYRIHAQRRPDENLNAPGMHFEPLAFASPCNAPDRSQPPAAGPNRFYAYGVVARLALLAAARELAEFRPAGPTGGKA